MATPAMPTTPIDHAIKKAALLARVPVRKGAAMQVLMPLASSTAMPSTAVQAHQD